MRRKPLRPIKDGLSLNYSMLDNIDVRHSKIKNNIKEKEMAINRDRNNTRQRTRTIFVPVGGGGSNIKTEELSVSENGTYEAGEDKAYSKVTVKVTKPLGTVKIADYGVKFSQSSFREVPEWADFDGVTNMISMFSDCYNLTTIPQIDTSSVTIMQNMFSDCYNLTTISQIDTSSVTIMESMFTNCFQLTTIPQIDTSSVTDMSYMFFSCSKLTTIPLIDTSSVTDMSYMFYSCSKLTTIPLIDTSSVTDMTNIFRSCSSLADLGGLMGLKCDIDLSSCPLTHDSIMNIVNKAGDVTASPKTLTLGSTNLAKLSDEEKAVATAKGWTLA